MSAIRLINEVPSSAAPAAVANVKQGSNQIAHLEVHSGAQASVPTIGEWHAHAITTAGEFRSSRIPS
jgi:hypothetical protein